MGRKGKHFRMVSLDRKSRGKELNLNILIEPDWEHEIYFFSLSFT
jgi:hypothetical protein